MTSQTLRAAPCAARPRTYVPAIPANGPPLRLRTAQPVHGAEGRKAALRNAWVAHTLKRAMAAVGDTDREDYRAIGLDRGELLAKLAWLSEAAARASAGDRIPLTVMLARSAPTPHPATAM